MEKSSGFLKDFSKENFSEERAALASGIKERRSLEAKLRQESDSISAELTEKDSEIEQFGKRVELAKIRLDEIELHVLGRITNFFEIRKLRAELGSTSATTAELFADIDQKNAKKIGIDMELSGTEGHSKSDKIEKMIHEFYTKQKLEWKNADYSQEDVKKNFSEEHLASLDLESYELLLTRFPSAMVTHVTRQGVRDHAALFEHRSGVGEFHHGFEELLKDGKLRSSLGLALKEGMKEETVAEVLMLNRFKTKQEAEEYLGFLLTEHPNMASYEDRAAIHMASDGVADKYYGAESNNEVFIAYPSAHVASQYFFRGGVTMHDGSMMNNDKWIWTKENTGMDVNAGIIFIPKDARVDRKTGSRYTIDSKGAVVTKEGKLEEATDTISSEEFWEEYFKNSEIKKPSKIVYYEGGDPTLGLKAWKDKANLYKESGSPDLGFTEHSVEQSHPMAQHGKERFKSLAEKVINDFFTT